MNRRIYIAGKLNDEEDALCGEIFNAMGKLHEILKDKVGHTKPNQCRENIDA